jgi:CheY-like chemotaxis protein
MIMVPDPVELLLVEDNLNDLELTMRALQRYNLANRMHVARDGAEALDFIFCTGPYSDRRIDDRPRVVLLDLKLPLVGGLEVLRQIRSEERTKHLPVVVLTSSREEQDVTESYDLGVNSYIVKPVDFVQFTEAVRQLGLYWMLLNEPPPR